MFYLRNVRVRSGEEHREAVEVAIAPVELGGQRYVAVPDDVLEPAGLERCPAVQDRRDRVGRGVERAGDNLLRAAIAAHGVDGNPDSQG